MLCYKDMTFCGFIECAKFAKCGRALTDGVREAAAMRRLYIAEFIDKPNCFKAKEGSDETNETKQALKAQG